MGYPDLGVRQEGIRPLRGRIWLRIGSLEALIGLAVVVTVLAACGLVGVIP